MYIGFELKKLQKECFKSNFEYYLSIGKKEFNDFEKKIEPTLKEFTNTNGSLNGDKMQSAWFPKIKADIFLSHSHTDKDLVIAFAGWLKHIFDLNVFIDSCIWGNSKDLQELIDIEHKVIWRDDNNEEWINYNKVQYSASHVHMMLNTALMQMIDNCECIIFVNTPHSVKPRDVVNKVVSPWIYSEIGMTKLIRKKELKEYRVQPIFEDDRSFSDKLKIEYNLDTDHLIKLSIDDLNEWKTNFNRQKNKPVNRITQMKGLNDQIALDYLYRLKEVR